MTVKPSDRSTFQIHRTSFAVSEKAMYSDSAIDVATFGAMCEVQEMGQSHRNMMYPMDDLFEGMLLL